MSIRNRLDGGTGHSLISERTGRSVEEQGGSTESNLTGRSDYTFLTGQVGHGE